MKRKKEVIIYILTSVFTTLLIYYVWVSKEDFKVLLTLSPKVIIVCFILTACSIVTNSYYTKVTANSFDIKLDLIDWLGVKSLSGLISLILPLRSDLMFTSTYYKFRCGISYSRFVSLTAGGMVIVAAVAAAEVVVGLSLLSKNNQDYYLLTAATLFILICVVVSLYLLINKRSLFVKVLPFKKYTVPVLDGFFDLYSDKITLIKSVLSVLATSIILIIKLYILFNALSLNINLYNVLIYDCVIRISDLFMIIPGNIGIRESLLGAVSVAVGSMFGKGVIVSLLLRVFSIVTYLFFGLVFSIPVMKRVNDIKLRKGNTDE